MKMRVYSAIALLFYGILSRAEAQQLYPNSQCSSTGGWPSVAVLNVQIPPSNVPCGVSWTSDQGFIVSNGTTWGHPNAANADTATSLVASPAQCGSGFSSGVAANGNANCRNIVSADLPPTISANTTGNAATATVATSATLASTATALAGSPTQCVGQFATGIAASGNANCSPQVAPPVNSPNVRTLSLATAFQATDNTRAAVVTLNLTSNASLTLSGGTTNTATVVIGATNAVAGGTGTTVGTYSNALTGTLVVGVSINSVATNPITFALPKNWFFAILQTSGTVSISSAFDQAIG